MAKIKDSGNYVTMVIMVMVFVWVRRRKYFVKVRERSWLRVKNMLTLTAGL